MYIIVDEDAVSADGWQDGEEVHEIRTQCGPNQAGVSYIDFEDGSGWNVWPEEITVVFT